MNYNVLFIEPWEPLAFSFSLPFPHVDPELSAQENGELMLPVAYESRMLSAAAHVPVTTMKHPDTIKKISSAIVAR